MLGYEVSIAPLFLLYAMTIKSLAIVENSTFITFFGP